MDASVCNPYEYRDIFAQVEHGEEFYRRFGLAKMRPREHRQAQINRRGIKGINHLVNVQSVRIARVKTTRFSNQNLRQVSVNTPVSLLVRVSKIGARDVSANAHGVTMATPRQARFNVPQTLSKSHLCKRHRQKLISRRETPTLPRHRVASHATVKLFAVQDVHHLRKYRLTFVHPLMIMNPKFRATRFKCVTPLKSRNPLFFNAIKKPKPSLNWTLVG